MIVPQYWAECRLQNKRDTAKPKQITLRRFGWSDVSQADAQAHADTRAHAAMQSALAGEKVAARDRKIPYNGAEGVPIREEVLSRHGAVVITRNSYGAHCLNSATVLFADIDYPILEALPYRMRISLALLLPALLLAWLYQSLILATVLTLLVWAASDLISAALRQQKLKQSGDPEQHAQRRITTFLNQHPRWGVRLYRTPLGMRVMATHQLFDAHDAEVTEFFRAVLADPVYIAMCRNQRCFRARVSAKPWRIGIDQHMPPRPGVWPINPKHLPRRSTWVAVYEKAASGYAACEFLIQLGNSRVHDDVEPVRVLHDQLSRAEQGLPLA
jgi:hypothetical protein